MKPNKTISILIPLLIIGFFVYQKLEFYELIEETRVTNKPEWSQNDNSLLSKIIKNQESGKILTLKARVVKILDDDNKGSRHQKLIIKIDRQTLLLAHNIDIAPRVPVKIADTIVLRGEYEWNEKGGLMHWTHANNNNSRHEGGWIKYNNKIYQ